MATERKKKAPKVPAYPCRDTYSKILQQKLGEECWAELPFHPKRRFRFDYAFPKVKVAIEIDGGIWTGGRHSGGAGQKKDFEKLNAAAELGWAVLHYVPSERLKGETLLQIHRTIQFRKNGDERDKGQEDCQVG